jgi:hypothetical protein
MYPQRMVKQALGLGLLVTLVVLVMSACGGGGAEAGGQEQAKARPLPEDEKALRPGEYRSEEFKPPLSFKVDEGWSTSPPEASDRLQLGWAETGTAGLAFTNVQEVYKPLYKPTETSTPKLVEAPEDLAGWFQNHPYLKTDEPKPATVGGVKGQQFDLVVEGLPEDHLSICGADCVDVIRGAMVFFEGDKIHLIVLEDVKGETVYIDFSTPVVLFDKFAPEAQKVVDSVKWGGS